MNRKILFDGATLKASAIIIMIKRNYFTNLIYIVYSDRVINFINVYSFKTVEKKPTPN